MTLRNDRLPDITSHIELIDRFLDGSIAAPEFQLSFLEAIKSEPRILGDPVFPILQELFEDADAYVEYPHLRDAPDDLDDEQLHECASRARQALRDLGYA
ncbi:colicin immunity domain-containing protein [Mycobacterium sp. pW049]|uniref:colicin immunity domain-containing protein n=1 Tax=[Mycobacterium] bulgaricum TaxID=3238985 RepID=UPI00351BCA1B